MKYYQKLIIRLSLALFLGLFWKIYYIIFKPLTLFLSFTGLKTFDNSAFIIDNVIFTNTHHLTFIDACVAASAYLLLTFLILVTKDIRFWKRIALFVYGSLLILSFNIIRIYILFYSLFNYDYTLFIAIHLLIWRFLSTIFVFLVWIYLTQKLQVKTIPIYSDLKYLINQIKKKN